MINIKNLSVSFPIKKPLFQKNSKTPILKKINLEIHRGEILGLVGESGCGKTTLGRTLIRLLQTIYPEVEIKGEIYFDTFEKNNILKLDKNQHKKFTKKVQMIFQDPHSSLNPRLRVTDILSEACFYHQKISNVKQRQQILLSLLEQVGLEEEHLYRYPHAFSGGQKQRIGIARALSVDPEFIVADECVSALDVSVQAQIINLLQSIQKSKNLTMLFISHDLNVVSHIADRIAVMHAGEIVELGQTEQIFENPKHPYTQKLLSAIPKISEKFQL